MSSPNLCLSSLILLLSILTPRISVALAQSPTSDLYSTCGELFTCGNSSGIGYPFWGGNRTVACGYPELELKCVNNITSIVLSSINYQVLGIFLNTEVMSIVREDYSSGLICSPVLTNSTFDPAVFRSVNGYTNFTFFYGCPTSAIPATPNQFSCNITGTPNSGGYMLNGTLGPGGCFASVFFPVPQSLLTNLNTYGFNLPTQLRQGFEVGLNVDFATCTSCNQSKGVCGYDQVANRTTCYCSDGSTAASGTCPSASAEGPTNSIGNGGNEKAKT